MTRRWLLREQTVPPDALARLDMPALVKRVLLARGFADAAVVERFCAPRLGHLHDPTLLPGADEAAQRLAAAVRAGRSIVIYGDYDVDGITATAILFRVIRTAAPAARVACYVPHRIDEGYGLNADALRRVRGRGADLVVSVDCGITAVEPARVAREIGLDLIITDHHNPPGTDDPLPDAVLVHPRLPGSTYPFGDLCGAGVAFKLAWQFARRWCGSERVSENLQRTLKDMLPLAALGTIADVVPLLDENRILTSYGLHLIKATPIAGLRALIQALDLEGERIDSHKVGFLLAPHLNACGRMGHAADAVRLLTDAAPAEAAAIARRLAEQNRERRRVEQAITEDAAHRAEEAGMTADDRRAIVLADESWHPGVVGIVCSRLVERYGRPVVLLQRQGDVCRGSARSIEGYSIHDALAATAAHLTRFGGHDAAAGLTLAADRLDAFAGALIDHANEHIAPDDLVPALRIDCDAELEELDLEAVRRLGELAPFGRANRRPAVRLGGTTLVEAPRPLGAEGRHLALRVRRLGDSSGRTVRAVWFGAGDRIDALAPGMTLDIVVEPKLNEFQNRVTVEGLVRDVRVRG